MQPTRVTPYQESQPNLSHSAPVSFSSRESSLVLKVISFQVIAKMYSLIMWLFLETKKSRTLLTLNSLHCILRLGVERPIWLEWPQLPWRTLMKFYSTHYLFGSSVSRQLCQLRLVASEALSFLENPWVFFWKSWSFLEGTLRIF